MVVIPTWVIIIVVWLMTVVIMGIIAATTFFEKMDDRSEHLQRQLDDILKRL